MGKKPEETNVAVIDDSPTVCKIVESILRREGYKVFTYFSGKAFFDAIDFNQITIPDIILLDIIMPDEDGFKVAQRLRNSNKFMYTKLAFITSRNSFLDRAKIRHFRAKHILKPFKPGDVLTVIKDFENE